MRDVPDAEAATIVGAGPGSRNSTSVSAETPSGTTQPKGQTSGRNTSRSSRQDSEGGNQIAGNTNPKAKAPPKNEAVSQRKPTTAEPKQKTNKDTSQVDEFSGLANKGKPHVHVPRGKALKRLLKEAKENGVVIHSDEDASRYLDYCARMSGSRPENYHAVTLGDDIFVCPQYAKNVRVLREELIHTQQQRSGVANSGNVVEMEIDARLQMLRNRHKWSITNDEVREMIQDIRTMRRTGEY
jgi:hypothetical protein